MSPVLSEMLESSSFWWTFVLVCAAPYTMILVAILFESRFPGAGANRLPLWRGQSKAYLPGALGLAFMVTTCLYLRSKIEFNVTLSVLLGLASIGLGVVVFYVMRKLMNSQESRKRSWRSPSKVWHDFVAFFLFTAALFYVCIPVWSAALIIEPQWQLPCLLGIGVAAVFWGGGMLYDRLFPERLDATRRHPDQWEWFWRH